MNISNIKNWAIYLQSLRALLWNLNFALKNLIHNVQKLENVCCEDFAELWLICGFLIKCILIRWMFFYLKVQVLFFDNLFQKSVYDVIWKKCIFVYSKSEYTLESVSMSGRLHDNSIKIGWSFEELSCKRFESVLIFWVHKKKTNASCFHCLHLTLD